MRSISHTRWFKRATAWFYIAIFVSMLLAVWFTFTGPQYSGGLPKLRSVADNPASSFATSLQNGEYSDAIAELKKKRQTLDQSLNSSALTSIANLYYLGLGLTQSYLQSARYYSDAAFSGSVAAQVNMGLIYSNGLGVQQNGELAYAWFNLARNNGSQIAQIYMSELLSQHKLSHQKVNKIRAEFATLDNFPALH